jgi:hypothetical protein
MTVNKVSKLSVHVWNNSKNNKKISKIYSVKYITNVRPFRFWLTPIPVKAG